VLALAVETLAHWWELIWPADAFRRSADIPGFRDRGWDSLTRRPAGATLRPVEDA
jgi:hypothetical protein